LIQLELKIPQGHIDQRVSAMREELMNDIRHIQAELDKERESLHLEKVEIDLIQKSLTETVALETERSRLAYEQALEKGILQGKETGYKKGYDAGFQEGHQKGQAEFDTIKEEYIANSKELLSKIKEVNDFKKLIFEKTEPYLLTLIKEIVRKVIAAEVSQTEDQMLMIIRDALKRVADMSSIQVRVHPQHVSFLNENKARFLSSIGTIHEMDIVADPSLDAGGCVIETDFGVVNASFETKMISILELINKTYPSLHPPVDTQTPDESPRTPVRSNDELHFEKSNIDEETLNLFEDDNEEDESDEDTDDLFEDELENMDMDMDLDLDDEDDDEEEDA
ncbi:MAG: FliH/SctL family protein, partial [Candidatus Margulisiibacteriota bacterium]